MCINGFACFPKEIANNAAMSNSFEPPLLLRAFAESLERGLECVLTIHGKIERVPVSTHVHVASVLPVNSLVGVDNSDTPLQRESSEHFNVTAMGEIFTISAQFLLQTSPNNDV